jgi:hypothetical protein
MLDHGADVNCMERSLEVRILGGETDISCMKMSLEVRILGGETSIRCMKMSLEVRSLGGETSITCMKMRLEVRILGGGNNRLISQGLVTFGNRSSSPFPNPKSYKLARMLYYYQNDGGVDCAEKRLEGRIYVGNGEPDVNAEVGAHVDVNFNRGQEKEVRRLREIP